jgi:hypothetical protein
MKPHVNRATDDRLFIICAMHRIGQDWAARYGLPIGSFKTITQAGSLLGMRRDARIVWLASRVDHPDAVIIERELKRRFTNVQYLDENGSPYTA